MNYDTEKYKVIRLPNLVLIHWILNPGLAFNEIFLGQRIPRITLVDKTSDAPLMERQYIPCSSCGEINSSQLWQGNGFWHWFGLVCPKCGSKIPCLWNLTSLLVLLITFPIWFPLKNIYEKQWIEKEKTRFRTMEKDAFNLPVARRVSWAKMGFLYGALMFCAMSLPKIIRNSLTVEQIAFQVALWMIAGLLFGLIMWFVLGRKK